MKKNNREKIFPFFKENNKVTYLDSAATSIKPKVVIDSIKNYYEKYSLPLGKGRNKITKEIFKKHEDSIFKISKFINCKRNEIIFTSSSTDGLNKLSNLLMNDLKEGDEIILGKFEHASNYLPWFEKAKNKKIKILFYELNDELTINLEHLKKIKSSKTKLIAISHKYNIFGTINNIKDIRDIIGNEVKIIVDGSQSIGQQKIDVKEMDCDFFVFSGHKMFAPFGIGVIYGKIDILKKIRPIDYGGGMNIWYDESHAQYKDIPQKFISGTINISGIIALGEAINFINKIGIDEIEKNNVKLKKYCEEKLSQIKNVRIINKGVGSSIIYFEVKNSLAEIISQFLDEEDIIVRPGASCVKMENEFYKTFKALRISFHIYNNEDDVDVLIKKLKSVNDFSKLKLNNKYNNMDICE